MDTPIFRRRYNIFPKNAASHQIILSPGTRTHIITIDGKNMHACCRPRLALPRRRHDICRNLDQKHARAHHSEKGITHIAHAVSRMHSVRVRLWDGRFFSLHPPCGRIFIRAQQQLCREVIGPIARLESIPVLRISIDDELLLARLVRKHTHVSRILTGAYPGE